jgi:hypothetical protein
MFGVFLFCLVNSFITRMVISPGGILLAGVVAS